MSCGRVIVAEDELTECGGRVCLHAGDHVGVDLHRERDRRVSKSFAHDFGGNASLEQQGRVGVSKVVEADAGDSCGPDSLPERLGERSGWIGDPSALVKTASGASTRRVRATLVCCSR